MKKKTKYLLFALVSAVLLSSIPNYNVSASVETRYGEIIDTVDAQDYSSKTYNHSEISTSYLVADGDGYLRVSAYFSEAFQDKISTTIDMNYNNSIDKIAIEHYNADFEVQSVQYLDTELPIFGGFYSSKDFYYMVYGQENQDESDAVEVIRVVQYDKNWNRLASASLYSANT